VIFLQFLQFVKFEFSNYECKYNESMTIPGDTLHHSEINL